MNFVQVLSPNAIAVRAPPATMAGEVDITLIFRVSGAQFCVNNPGKFIYTGMCLLMKPINIINTIVFTHT